MDTRRQVTGRNYWISSVNTKKTSGMHMGRRIEKNDLKFYTGFSSTLLNKIVNVIYIVILSTTWLMFL